LLVLIFFVKRKIKLEKKILIYILKTSDVVKRLLYLRQGVHDESVEGEVDEPLVLGIEPELDDVGLGDLGSLELKVDVARDVKVAIVRGITILVLKNQISLTVK
jgi:hypothetical protein